MSQLNANSSTKGTKIGNYISVVSTIKNLRIRNLINFRVNFLNVSKFRNFIFSSDIYHNNQPLFRQ